MRLKAPRTSLYPATASHRLRRLEQEAGLEFENSVNLGPLDALRLRARTEPGLFLQEAWRLEMLAAITAARANGVSSETLEPYESLLSAA